MSATRATLIDLDRFYTALFPEYRFDAPFGVEEFVDAHVNAFPHEEKGLRAFVDLCRQVTTEWGQARPRAGGLDDLGSTASFQTVLEHRTATVAEVLDRYVEDPRLKSVVTSLWGYHGVPPSRLSFIAYAGMTISLLEGGQTYCQGSFQNLVDCFVTAVERGGGEIVVGTEVTKVVVRNGRVGGVTLADEREVNAPVVVSNVDLLQTVERLVGPEQFPESYVRRLRRMTPGISAFVVYAATTLDFSKFGIAHEVFAFKEWSHDDGWRRVQAGEIAASMISIPTLEDPSLAPPGHHCVVGVAFMPFDVGRPWRELKESYMEQFLDDIDGLFPGFRDGLTFAEGATPQALYGYSLNQNGAMYGWENSPAQVHSRRPGNSTPVEGLYAAGAWTQPGSGTIATMQSGFQTAQAILGYEDRDRFLTALGYDASSRGSGAVA